MEDKNDYFIVGRVLKPFGIAGEVKVLPITDNIERFRGISFLFLKKYGRYVKVPVKSSRIAHKTVLLKLGESTNRDDAERYRGEYLYIDRKNAVKLPENSYYYYDIWKCRVVTTEGKELGIVEDIQNAGSCDVYTIRLKDKDDTVMIPAISDVIKKIDIESKKIIIEVLEGLI